MKTSFVTVFFDTITSYFKNFVAHLKPFMLPTLMLYASFFIVSAVPLFTNNVTIVFLLDLCVIPLLLLSFWQYLKAPLETARVFYAFKMGKKMESFKIYFKKNRASYIKILLLFLLAFLAYVSAYTLVSFGNSFLIYFGIILGLSISILLYYVVPMWSLFATSDGLKPLETLNKCFALVRGNFWPHAGILFLNFAFTNVFLQFTLTLVLTLIFRLGGITLLLENIFSPAYFFYGFEDAGKIISDTMITIFVASFCSSFTICALTNWYMELKKRKEPTTEENKIVEEKVHITHFMPD